jgi:hypothetical protein
MTQHKAIPLAQRHGPFSFEYADAVARLAAVGFTAADVGKAARQLDTGSGWVLSDHAPVTWTPFASVPDYTNLVPMIEDVGGWEAGSTFAGVTMEAMLDGLLYPYQYPAFSAFAMAGQSSPIEVGASLLVNPTFTWSTTNSGNVEPNTVDILDVTGSATLVSNTANDGSQAVTLAAVTKLTATSHVFRVRADDTHVPLNTFTRDATYVWQWRSFYGESASAALNEAGVEGLRANALAAGFAGTYVFVEDELKYKYIAYAAALGLATTFKDQATNLDIPMEAAETVSIANAYGEPTRTNYNVHRTTNLIGGAVNIVVT